jgi:hypothetical protein
MQVQPRSATRQGSVVANGYRNGTPQATPHSLSSATHSAAFHCLRRAGGFSLAIAPTRSLVLAMIASLENVGEDDLEPPAI